MRAVLIAGDHRTFNEGIGSAYEILRGADVYVSMWSESKFAHQCRPNKFYVKNNFNEQTIRTALNPHNVVDVVLEKHDTDLWLEKGYNSNFLHRMRCGVDMIKKSGKTYDSVIVLRPDFFFGNCAPLAQAVSTIRKNEFMTIWMPDYRIVNRNLNDTLFAVRGEDLDRAIPTVEQYQPFKEQDWHQFLFDFTVNAGFTISNVEGVHCAILRPPAKMGMTYEDALKNTEDWDNDYILHVFREFGFSAAIKNWSKPNVLRALKTAGCDDQTIANLLGPA